MSNSDMLQIAFFDLETTMPTKPGDRFWVLEFGAVVICPQKLMEVGSYCTLIRPGDLNVVPLRPRRQGGITRRAVAMAPSFEDVADKIYEILHGRIWAGHNIQRFDCVRIKEAFANIGRSAPEPIGLIDSLGVLTEKFGRRAGNMKMATLANYFGLEEQKHRSLEDVRLNMEVLKSCATVLLLESSVPSALSAKWKQGSGNMITRSRYNNNNNNRRLTRSKEDQGGSSRKSPPISLGYQRAVPYTRDTSFTKVTERVKRLLRSASGSQSINNLLKHSHSLIK